MLGLMGDASDNIPGCPGVGEKTAQKLIAEFGSIENLLEHTDQLKGALKTKVETNREMITFSKFLATIKTDVPIQLDMDSLVREEPNEEELRKISRSWNSAHSSIGYSKGKRQFVLPYSNLSGTRPLCRDSVCPAANLHSRKQRPDSRRFVCKFCGRGDGRF